MPKKVGRYRLLAPIARGGTATVYLGRSQAMGGFSRIVAVKLLHPHLLDDAAANASNEFLEEAKLSAQMKHPLIVPVLDVGESDDGYYLVMDYVDGASLSEVLRLERNLPRPILGRILYDVLEALHVAHTAKDDRGNDLGIVHRDFSPQNILVGTDGRSRLTDFGIARATSRAEYTRTGLIKGKISYMSPEQAEGTDLDERTDVWAAGVVAWEMFAGARMYPKMDPMPQLLKIINNDPPRLKDRAANISAELENAVHSALVRNQDERCASARDLRESIAAAMGGPNALASHAEVGEFLTALNIERLDQLRAIVHDASESRSVPPPAAAALVQPTGSEPPTVEEPHMSRRSAQAGRPTQESSGTYATSSTTNGTRSESPAKKIRLAMIGAVGIALGLYLTLSAETGPDASPEPAVKEATAPPAPRPVEEPKEEPPPAESPERQEVEISANRPMNSVKLEDRLIALPKATKKVSVRLTDVEKNEKLTLEAVSSDGATVTAQLEARQLKAALTFPPVEPPPAAKKRAPLRRKPAAKKKPQLLAPSPY